MSATNGNGPSRVSEKFANAGVEVKDGEWFPEVIARSERAYAAVAMSARAHRAHHWLGLHTMAFQQELAVIPIGKDKFRPATPTDMAKDLGVKVADVWHILEELKFFGLGDHQGKTKGNIRIYAWAVPRGPKPEIVVTRNNKRRRRGELPTLLDHYKAFRINVPPSFVFPPDKENELMQKADFFLSVKTDFEGDLRAAIADDENSRVIDKVVPPGANGCPANENIVRRVADFEAVSSQTYCSDTDTEDTDGRTSSIRESAVATAPLIVRPSALPSLAEHVRQFLIARYRQPMELDDEILGKIMAYIPDAPAFQQFKEACQSAKPKKPGWGLFVLVAEKCALKRQQLSAAVVNRPITTAERDRRTTEIMRRGVPIAKSDLDWLSEQYPDQTVETLEQIARETASEACGATGAASAGD